MGQVFRNIIDKQIFYLSASKKLTSWEGLYDEYAGIMYGMIYNLTGDKELAEKILLSFFVRLKKEGAILKIEHGLCIFLLRYTYNFTLQQLKSYHIQPIQCDRQLYPEVINLLCTKYSSVSEVASHINISEEEVVKKLQTEFYYLRNKISNV